MFIAYLDDRRVLVHIVEPERSKPLIELEANESAVEVNCGVGPDASADVFKFQASVDVELTEEVEVDAAVRQAQALTQGDRVTEM